MPAPQPTAELSLTVARPIRRGGYTGYRSSAVPFNRRSNCTDGCQDLLAYCEDGGTFTDILCKQGRLCEAKCSCYDEALSRSEGCLQAAQACSNVCQEAGHVLLDCVVRCGYRQDTCNFGTAYRQHSCNASAEATYGDTGTGGTGTGETVVPQCPISYVTVWINAFIPGDIPGLTIPVPGQPGKTMIPGPPLFGCFYTDHRSFNNLITASARMHQDVTLNVGTAEFGNPLALCDPTVQADCVTGAEEATRVGDSSGIRAYGYANPVPGVFEFTVEAAAHNPLVPVAPNIDYKGKVSIAIIPDNAPDGSMIEKAKIDFSGLVDPFPAFEMYAAVNGGPGHAVFQRLPDPGSDPYNLFGDPDRYVSGTAIIDCYGGGIPVPGRSRPTRYASRGGLARQVLANSAGVCIPSSTVAVSR